MLQPGEQIGVCWVVDERLGHSRSSVFLCHNREAPDIRAAIKLIDPTRGSWAVLRNRLLLEAESMLALDHPNLARITNLSLKGPLHFIEMEYIEGRPLSSLIGDPSVTSGRVVDWIASTADALSMMHANGLRHRDIKPANLLLRADGRGLCLVDIGLPTSEPVVAPQDLAYLPPEADTPGGPDPISWDIYALGITCWELLRGSRAFKDAAQQGAAEVARLKRALGPLDPGDDLPLELRALVRQLTHPIPRKRIQTVEQLRERLGELDLDTTDPGFRFDNSISTWDPDEQGDKLTGRASETWHPGDEAKPLHSYAAPTMPPLDDSEPPEEDSQPPPEDGTPPQKPAAPTAEPTAAPEPASRITNIVAPDPTSRTLVGIIVLLLIALGISLVMLAQQ
ncbi:MAG: serine/threonine protein kinase [Alphaproteobacteria bacterium]|nr:serine/threonine protein kinase [Alphaproteobacteria bacterium]